MYADQAENRESSQTYKTPKIVNSYSFNNIKKSVESLNPLELAQNNNPVLIQQQNLQTVKIINKRNSSNVGNSENNFNYMNNEDTQSTTRRGPPKIHYHKLPSAFANLSINPQKKLKIGIFSQMNLPKPTEEDIVKKIDNMVDVQEYKQIQNLLSPLKIREGKVIHNKQKKLFSFHDQSNSNNDSKIGNTLMTPLSQDILANLVKAQPNNQPYQISGISNNNSNNRISQNKEKSNNNPLNPLREYIDSMQKFKDQFKEVPDLLMDRINQLILKNDKLGYIENQPLQLNQLNQHTTTTTNGQPSTSQSSSTIIVSTKYLQSANSISINNNNNNNNTTTHANSTNTDMHLKKGFSIKNSKDSNLAHNINNDSNTTSINKSNSLTISSSSVFKVRLEEMITLNLMKSQKNSGAIKKMLHAPTLSIFAVKEQPIVTKEIRKILKDWLNFWPATVNSNEQFIRIYGTYWNIPEGCVSIIMEHMNGGSLQDLLENIGNLNERALQELTLQIISALYTLHNEHQVCHGNISPSQILFNKQGFLKLSLGISNRTQTSNTSNSSIFNTGSYNKNEKKSINDYQSLVNIWSKNVLERNEVKAKSCDLVERQDEVFKLGLLLLVSALGSLDLLDDQLSLFFEQVQKQVELSNKTNDTKMCCLLHNEENMISSMRNSGGNSQSINSQLSINTLLSKHSDNFKDFLCKCLKYNYRSRLSIEELLKHPFIQQEQNQQIPSLRELISVSNKIQLQYVPLPEKYQAASEKQFDRVCEGISMILPNCQIWFKVPQYMEFVQHLPNLDAENAFIIALANDLGIETKKIYSKLKSTYETIQVYKDFKHKLIFNPSNNV